MSDEEANCAARRVVGSVDDATLDQMIANGGETTDLDPETSLKVLDGILDCVDLEEMMVQSMVSDGTPEDEARCVAENFGEDELRGFMEAASLPEDQVDEEVAFEIIGKMFEIAAECGLDFGG